MATGYLGRQGEDRLHHGSPSIQVEQLAGNETRLVSAEECHGIAYFGWYSKGPHGCPAALVLVPDHLEHLGRQPARPHPTRD